MQARNPLWDAVDEVAEGLRDPNTPDANGNPLIFQVIATSNVKMLNALLDTDKVKFDVKNSDGKTPVQYCITKASEIGAQRKIDAKYMQDIEQGIQIPQGEYNRLKAEMKKESGDNALADAVFRSMGESIQIKAGKIAEVKPTTSAPSSPFVERKNVSEKAQDLVTQMQILKEYSSVAEEAFKNFISVPISDPNKKSLEAYATKQVTKFCNLLDKYNDDRVVFNDVIVKSKNAKGEISYVNSAYKEFLKVALPTQQLEQRMNINPAERKEKAKQDNALLAGRSQSEPGLKTKTRSSSLGGEDARGPKTRARSASVISPSQGNSISMLKNIYKRASPSIIRKDLAASAESSPTTEKAQSAAASPKTEKMQSAAASAEVTPTTPTSSPAAEKQEQEEVRSPGMRK